MVPLDFQVKWVQWDLPVKKDNVVILAQWAILVSKVRRVIKDIMGVGVTWDPPDPHAQCPLRELLIVSKCPRKIILMIKERVQKNCLVRQTELKKTAYLPIFQKCFRKEEEDEKSRRLLL